MTADVRQQPSNSCNSVQSSRKDSMRRRPSAANVGRPSQAVAHGGGGQGSRPTILKPQTLTPSFVHPVITEFAQKRPALHFVGLQAQLASQLLPMRGPGCD